MNSFPFDAVLFDCDGVLVDSEPITARVLTTMLGELGWPITLAETMLHFTGKAVRDQADLIQARSGQPLTAEWLTGFWQRRNAALEAELVEIAGAPASVRSLHATLRGRIAVASGADRGKVEMQLKKVGIYDCFAGRIFSGHEMPRSKPHPDVYLAAAAALAVDPARCAIVEDTVTGALAGVATGATVFGYSPGGIGHSSAAELLDVGVSRVFQRMDELPSLLADWERAPETRATRPHRQDAAEYTG